MASFLLLAAAAAAVGVTDNPCPTPPAPPSELAERRELSTAAAQRAAYEAARKSDWANLCRYRADNARLMTLPRAEREVVFMGDSITEGWAIADPAFYREGRINRGISGQTTQQMLLRFPQDVLALRPRAVHIMAGTNDVAGNTGPTTLDAIEGNIAAMIELAKAARIRVVLAATPPCAAFKWAPTLQPALVIAALNQRLRALAAREKVTFVDYGAVLATAEGALRPEYTYDGTHFNAAGYAAIEATTLRALARR